MNFTAVFIRRPVLAIVISLAILLLGIRAFIDLPVREFPAVENASVTVSTSYYGADQDVMAGFITAPLEAAISQAQGIDYLSSTTTTGLSVITANLRLNYDANRAIAEINAKVNSVLNQLPSEAQQPEIAVTSTEATAALVLNFSSEKLTTNQITDYLLRSIQPQLQAIPGVLSASIAGGRQFALRIWLDPIKLAAVGLTATDVHQAISANNYVTTLGATKGQMLSVKMSAETSMHSVEEFRSMVIKRKGISFVRLMDVADVTLGAESYDVDVRLDGKKAVAVMIDAAPNANVLDVATKVREIFPQLNAQLPSGLRGTIVYDATDYVRSSIDEVKKTLLESFAVVAGVTFLFLGKVRAIAIPIIAVPLSLIGTFSVMLAFGYSINLLTLLALVLSVGLVVDDAIIIVENIDRHIFAGSDPFAAALKGAQELAGPILAISIVLIAVYIPIGFQGGLTGALFNEFAFTLAAAVAISAVIALTLSPMMCANMLKAEATESRLNEFIDEFLGAAQRWYRLRLDFALDNWPVFVVLSAIVIASVFVLLLFSESELAPSEDQGFVVAITNGPSSTTTQQMRLFSKQVYQIAEKYPEIDHLLQIDGAGNVANLGVASLVMKPWQGRYRSAQELSRYFQAELNSVAGAQIASYVPSSLPGGGSGMPLQLIVKTMEPFNRLDSVVQALTEKALSTGKFDFLANNLKYSEPQNIIAVDRDKAASLGLSMQDIGAALGSMLGGGYINYFNIDGRSYKVIPQVQQAYRLNADQLKDYFIRSGNGEMISAATVISIKEVVAPEKISRFQRFNAATISGIPNVPLGEAITTLQEIAGQVLPTGYLLDYGEESRQHMQKTNSFALTLGMALTIVFLVLAAQFESFRKPLIIMASVPMAIFGAAAFTFLGVVTLNIYTEVGLITLIGLISKHGILIVQYASEVQSMGHSKRAAIEHACLVRLRPILMTTAAMVLGSMPLILASGPGAASRNSLGLIIVSGISIGTLFTLFIVPAMYLFVARNTVENNRVSSASAAIERCESRFERNCN